MPTCSIYGCFSSSHNKNTPENVRYYRFPKQQDLCKRWISACNRTDKINVNHARVCSLHFETRFHEKPLRELLLGYSPKNGRKLTSDAVPTLNLPKASTIPVSLTDERQKRLNKRTNTKFVQQILKNVTLKNTEVHPKYNTCPQETATAVRNEESSSEKRLKNTEVHPKYNTCPKETATAVRNEESSSEKRLKNTEVHPKYNTCPKETATAVRNEESSSEKRLVKAKDIHAGHKISTSPQETATAVELCTLNEVITLEKRLSEDNDVRVEPNIYTCQQETATAVREEETTMESDRQPEAIAANEMAALKNKIEQLERERDSLSKKLTSSELQKRKLLEELSNIKKKEKQNINDRVHSVLSPIFTPGQIKCLLTKKKRVSWTIEDYAAAISLRSVSPKAYRYLRGKMNYPLPALSTLRKWALKSFCLDEGVLKDILKLLQSTSRTLTEIQRVTILSYDEMYLSEEIGFDKKKEQILGPCKAVQVVFARGLVGNWKQPIYYKFDEPINALTLKNIINELEEIGYPVVGVVSDLGGSNLGVWRDLKITPQNPYFVNPYTPERKVYCFADAPHLIKLLRNHFIDEGFEIEKMGTIDKTIIEQILNQQSGGELKIAPKLMEHHLMVRGSQRQRVWPATQLFSNTTSKAIHWLGERNLIKGNWRNSSEIFKLVNDWFDIMNTGKKFGLTQNAYGCNILNQNKILDQMNNITQSIKTGKKKGKNDPAVYSEIVSKKEKEPPLLPFQTGIITSNNALKQMYEFVSSKYGIKYIMTQKLNQDIIEHFFSYIRGMGISKDHPTALDFRYRLRWYVLGKHSSVIFKNAADPEKTQSQLLPETPSLLDNCVTQELLAKIIPQEAMVEDVEPEEALLDHDYDAIPGIDNAISREGLRYLAGYVAFIFKNKFPQLEDKTKTMPDNISNESWIDFISRGRLTQPSESLYQSIIKAEECFGEFHRPYINNQPGSVSAILDQYLSLGLNEDVNKEVIRRYISIRTHIKIKQINRKLRYSNALTGEKRQLVKKLKKVA